MRLFLCGPFRQEKHPAVLEHMVSALNIFLRSVATNCRMRLCHLGEELMPSVLQVWADMRPSPALKEEIVEFFNLQIRAHHPKGAKTQDTGTVVFPFILKHRYSLNVVERVYAVLCKICRSSKRSQS